MAPRTARQKRALALWTAGWLFVLLLVGVVWLGDLWLQWPVLLVPVVWALVAVLRGRTWDDPGDDPGDDQRDERGD